MPDGSTPPTNPRPADPSTSHRDPIHDLITRLDRDASTIAAKDPDLSRTIHQLSETALRRPEWLGDATFRTRVAYALQDMEKLGGPITAVPQILREEMGRLAVTAPNLKDERLQAMMQATPAIDDARLVREIRSLAVAAGGARMRENAAPSRDVLDNLENRVRLASSPAGPVSSGPDQRSTIPEGRSWRPAGTDIDQTHASRSPGSQTGPIRDVPGWEKPAVPPSGSETNNPPQATVTGRGPGVVAQALAALARHAQQESPNWDRQPTSVVDRSARHEDAFQQRRDEATIQGAEKSQRAAMEAVRAFSQGPASNILTKIQDAAKAEPGGMPAVLSEMREGGRFASLRSQFNADLVVERGAAAAWDRMAGSLQQYGADRSAVAAIGARQNTAAALDARFEKMDAEIGKATSIIPSRHDGKSVMDDLGDKFREILDRAINAVKSAFRPSAERNARPSDGPSPGP
ncbi:hypothetical protein [Acidisphaera sp. L21]|uniref:hypothetical protein n=1 Tax=Acidisphaera sp. L21 TaxID=1641851 RepID=UPI001C202B7A|nr:hypothetical protein [Acidisphaera sp. L21]